jgi:hypothetical protein
MSQQNDSDSQEEQHDGFNVVAELSPREWVYYDTEGWDEYIHLVVDREARELRCYRSSNEGFPNERVKTTIEGVNFRFSYDDDVGMYREREGAKVVTGYYLTWQQANTFLTFVDILARSRGFDSSVKMTWYENNEKPSMAESRINDETITLTFRNDQDQERSTQIQDSWKAHTNQMAKYDQ